MLKLNLYFFFFNKLIILSSPIRIKKLKKSYFTSEYVTKGHPDKIADQISDAILDELLRQDAASRAAVETTVEKDYFHIMGEVTTKARLNAEEIARRTIREIGYTDPSLGFSDSSEARIKLHEQSPDISMGVDSSYDDKGQQGAGDQGLMFGYAVGETRQLMPLALMASRELTDLLTARREDGSLPYLRPDGKSQVTVEYEGRKVRRIDTVVISTQHDESVTLGQLRSDIMENIVEASSFRNLMDDDTRFFINPTGRFVLGGPAADTGLTGRKIIVDTYGGRAHHGGGAFSGKDATKVDRSAAYALRNIAKTIVSSGVADECELQVAYAIGVAEPVSVLVDTFGTARIDEEKIEAFVRDNFDLRPGAIIDNLGLRNPIFLDTARYGHFGRPGYSWEKVDQELVGKLAGLI